MDSAALVGSLTPVFFSLQSRVPVSGEAPEERKGHPCHRKRRVSETEGTLLLRQRSQRNTRGPSPPTRTFCPPFPFVTPAIRSDLTSVFFPVDERLLTTHFVGGAPREKRSGNQCRKGRREREHEPVLLTPKRWPRQSVSAAVTASTSVSEVESTVPVDFSQLNSTAENPATRAIPDSPPLDCGIWTGGNDEQRRVDRQRRTRADGPAWGGGTGAEGKLSVQRNVTGRTSDPWDGEGNPRECVPRHSDQRFTPL
ncbi:hypothetical protein WN55_07765 [Dufourea novaeangliae]|uniref:Uncharacterized protein n=1 Tax=Dufourea novaeangliae TaxID=178035 RepID=A0A154P6Q1_DUFNO|nr:hypothetical protein WN55_07765 [Dufourea novaeangliae]